ncbi:hypothetical protein GCM10011390_00580 [Aureimonas endophytica]|uniref:Uncharacterized protein n=1 Tax=Aureimonas endophytica TaxID=2027858 RepID=A0A916ZBB7_9HYPH|nr:hypothetical protein [Aureimonas endophytica]GGD85918.1 hypothetical protein GCM10011390_00580 [Aureimonas endophytica]
MLKWASLFLGIAIGVAIFLGFKWHAYVTRGPSPYDELGIELNGLVPQSLGDWGCARLAERFAQAVPPQGCAGPDGRWRVPGAERP